MTWSIAGVANGQYQATAVVTDARGAVNKYTVKFSLAGEE
jgi:hypothetical protein